MQNQVHPEICIDLKKKYCPSQNRKIATKKPKIKLPKNTKNLIVNLIILLGDGVGKKRNKL